MTTERGGPRLKRVYSHLKAREDIEIERVAGGDRSVLEVVRDPRAAARFNHFHVAPIEGMYDIDELNDLLSGIYRGINLGGQMVQLFRPVALGKVSLGEIGYIEELRPVSYRMQWPPEKGETQLTDLALGKRGATVADINPQGEIKVVLHPNSKNAKSRDGLSGVADLVALKRDEQGNDPPGPHLRLVE